MNIFMYNGIKMDRTIEEQINKSCGLIWGAIIADALGNAYQNRITCFSNNKYIKTPNDVKFEEDENDWTFNTDLIILISEVLVANNLEISVDLLANSLKRWRSLGFQELNNRGIPKIGSYTNSVINNMGFIKNPIKCAADIHKMSGGEIADNGSVARNYIMGLTPKWQINTINQCIITHSDVRCVVSCMVQSFIINSLWTSRPLDWDFIYKKSVEMLRNGVHHMRDLQEFDDFWYSGHNYDKTIRGKDGVMIYSENNNNYENDYSNSTNSTYIDSEFIKFMKKLQIGNKEKNENQNFCFIPMAIAIAVVHDIEYAREHDVAMNTLYYEQKIKEIICLGGNASVNAAIAGSIIGLQIKFAEMPFHLKNMILNKDWLDKKIRNFIYFIINSQ